MNPDGPPSDPTAPIPSSAAQPDALSTPPAYPWATTASAPVAPYPQVPSYPPPSYLPPSDLPPSILQPSRPQLWSPGTDRPQLPPVGSPFGPPTQIPLPWGPTPAPRRRNRWMVTGLVAFVLVAVLFAVLGFVGSKVDHDGLTSDTSCAEISADSVDFGVQVTNTTAHSITLTGATIVGLPRTMTSNDSFSWQGCDPTDTATVPSGQPELAPRATQWVLVGTTLNATCPGDASPDIVVSYVDGSKSNTATIAVGPLSDALPPCASSTGFGF